MNRGVDGPPHRAPRVEAVSVEEDKQGHTLGAGPAGHHDDSECGSEKGLELSRFVWRTVFAAACSSVRKLYDLWVSAVGVRGGGGKRDFRWLLRRGG